MAILELAENAAMVAWEHLPAAISSYLIARRDSVEEVEEILTDPMEVGGLRRELNQ